MSACYLTGVGRRRGLGFAIWLVIAGVWLLKLISIWCCMAWEAVWCISHTSRFPLRISFATSLVYTKRRLSSPTAHDWHSWLCFFNPGSGALPSLFFPRHACIMNVIGMPANMNLLTVDTMLHMAIGSISESVIKPFSPWVKPTTNSWLVVFLICDRVVLSHWNKSSLFHRLLFPERVWVSNPMSSKAEEMSLHSSVAPLRHIFFLVWSCVVLRVKEQCLGFSFAVVTECQVKFGWGIIE